MKSCTKAQQNDGFLRIVLLVRRERLFKFFAQCCLQLLCSHKSILLNWCTHEVRHNNEVERLLIRLITAALTNSTNSVKWAIYLQKQVVCFINYVLNYNKGTGTLMCTTTIMEKLHADRHNEFHLRLSTYHVMVLKKTNGQDTGGFFKLSAIKLHLHLWAFAIKFYAYILL